MTDLMNTYDTRVLRKPTFNELQVRIATKGLTDPWDIYKKLVDTCGAMHPDDDATELLDGDSGTFLFSLRAGQFVNDATNAAFHAGLEDRMYTYLTEVTS